MNAELKEKMQEAAENASNGALCVGCPYMNGDWTGHSCLDCRGTKMQQEFFLAGTSAMYAELASLVEWINVKDRLPYSDGYYLTKDGKEISLLFFSTFLQKFSKYTTHWKKIEL